MRARELTRKAPVSVGPDSQVHAVAELMDRMVVGAVVVVEGSCPSASSPTGTWWSAPWPGAARPMPASTA